MTGDGWGPSSTDAWTMSKSEEWSPEGFWASYSDLMAGVLMIFVLATALFTRDALKTTEVLQEWRDQKQRLCDHPELKHLPGVRYRCETGELEFQTAKWFAFGRSALPPDAKETLLQVMPIWLGVVTENEHVWSKIDAIEFAGFADRLSATELGNMEVSADRAKEVMAFLVENLPDAAHKRAVLTRGIVVGYGHRMEHYPPECEGRDQCDEARRVIVRVNFDETSILQDLWRILEPSRS